MRRRNQLLLKPLLPLVPWDDQLLRYFLFTFKHGTTNHLSFLADLGKCPNGWEERVGSNQCYLITDVHDMRTRDDASAQCQLQQGQLVKIDSIAERVIIIQTVAYL